MQLQNTPNPDLFRPNDQGLPVSTPLGILPAFILVMLLSWAGWWWVGQ
jgi:hypothetical protein